MRIELEPAPPRAGGRGDCWGEGMTNKDESFPKCLKCGIGVLVPLSDYGRDGAPIMYKAWVCTSPECGYNLRIDNGEISNGRPVGQSTK